MGDPPAGIAVGGTFLTSDPMGYADSPNLYQFGLNNPVNFSEPHGLAVIEKGDVRYVQEEIARKRQEALRRLLTSAEGYLSAHQGESEEQLRMGLARHLAREGFAGPEHEAHGLAARRRNDHLIAEDLQDRRYEVKIDEVGLHIALCPWRAE